MRSIKFRAWDKQLKKMDNVHSLDLVNEFASYWDQEKRYSSQGHDMPVILMQYTGLKDRNGKEIYEGDYIKCPELYETPESTGKTYMTTGYIVFEEGAWRFYDGGLVFEEYDSYDGDFEVVGNMYEHSHKIEVS